MKGMLKYLRELSIVIIGVLVTLTITNITSLQSKKNEVKEMMELIRIELTENFEKLEEAEQKYESEQRIFRMLRQNIEDIQSIPEDTLFENRMVIGDIHSINYSQDSYEVFKSSLLMQYVKDKEFLRKLSRTYDRLRNVEEQLGRYSQLKVEAMENYRNNMTEEELKKWSVDNIYDFYISPLNETSYRKFLYIGGSILAGNLFKSNKKALLSMIYDIEDKY